MLCYWLTGQYGLVKKKKECQADVVDTSASTSAFARKYITSSAAAASSNTFRHVMPDEALLSFKFWESIVQRSIPRLPPHRFVDLFAPVV